MNNNVTKLYTLKYVGGINMAWLLPLNVYPFTLILKDITICRLVRQYVLWDSLLLDITMMTSNNNSTKPKSEYGMVAPLWCISIQFNSKRHDNMQTGKKMRSVGFLVAWHHNNLKQQQFHETQKWIWHGCSPLISIHSLNFWNTWQYADWYNISVKWVL